MELTRFFSNLSKNDVNLAGGKGASLGEMTRAGIPVPNGFVILAGSFEKFLEETDLNVELDAILDSVNHKEMQSIEDASEKIKALILGAEMPKDIEKQIKKDFKELNAKYVAVRSSATSEDSSTAAWAGQLDSFLNTTEKDLLEKVKRCWASLFTPRAIFYRFEKGLHGTKISVAVVVQKMVESEISGIAFSVHPVTQDRNQLIIEAGFGLGEAIVSGQITPDSYVVEKVPRRIIDKNVSEQEKGIFKVECGGNEWKNVSDKGSQQKISDKQILELSEIILRIEKHYGFPCDIEWAFEKGKFFIVQSRPITTLTDKTGDKEMPSAEKDKKKENEFEELKSFLEKTPLDLKAAKCNSTLAGIVFTSYVNSRAVCGGYDTIFIPYQNNMLSQDIIQEKMDGVEKQIWEISIKNPKQLKKWISTANNTQKQIDKMSLTETQIRKLSDKKLADYYSKIVEKSLEWWLYGVIGEEKGLIVEEKILPELLKSNKKSEHEVREYIMTATTPLNPSIFSKEREAFLNLCLKAKRSPELLNFLRSNPTNKREEFAKEIKKYTKNYFFARTDFYASPRMDEKGIIDQIKNENKKTSAEKIIEEIKILENGSKELAKKQKSLAKLKISKEAKQYLWYFSEMQKWIDYRKHSMTKHFKYLNDVVYETAKRKKLDYSVAAMLFPKEIIALLNGENTSLELAQKRKQSFFVYKINQPIKEYYGKQAQELIDTITKTNRKAETLKGTVASKGNEKTVSGKVKIVMNPSDDPFEEGEILVTTMTNPEFLPAMQKASAIITDDGGLLCHAAIVSRELGKPCIIGTKNATKILKNGDLIEVDANHAVVTILEKSK